MKLIYKAALLICSSVFAMSVQAAGMPQSSKHAQRRCELHTVSYHRQV